MTDQSRTQKTHFADDETLAYIAKLEREAADLRERLAKAEAAAQRRQNGCELLARLENTPLHSYDCDYLDPYGHQYKCNCDAEEFRESLLAALSAPQPADGVVVPREPTERQLAELQAKHDALVKRLREPDDDMLDAGHEAGDFHILHYDGTDKPGTPRYSLRKSFVAMTAVALKGGE